MAFVRVRVRWQEEPFLRFLYIRRYSAKKDGDGFPPERTVYLTNLPPDVTDDELEDLLEPVCGAIQMIFSSRIPHPEDFDRRGFVLVVFHEEGSVAKALGMANMAARRVLVDRPPGGMAKWVGEYRGQQKSAGEIKREADSFMRNFDEEQARRNAERESNSGRPDEDGFIKVVRRKKGVSSGNTHIRAAKPMDAADVKEKTHKGFYGFQARQDRISRIAELQARFQKDKERIARLREQRAFKPY
mmetsp:Transcript_12198/g.34404  ORF Transcript_12198/g.34404 Transcript_12198/m.34404 type:complete len:244 (-) Transcript_12198:171-902(-)|eukprot:CAMPEP_0119121462 /NCGR_PEP_ID=MMETSP1310-20130426/2084_1 /TAXON_ID=464262 /ORGANISM="Genus nov. species nov., Strain RCC2339" /LENGTH=243 /DNA_ID=CAMNT_0007111029 /DNA_START=218 /DNA_END=949 /DNA_ORIENTATION=+